MIRFKKIPGDIDNRIGHLAEFLEMDSSVIFAYIFGGLLRNKRNPFSDVDIAIYQGGRKSIDYMSLFSEISEVLGTEEIDLIILNSAPISLAGRILQKRKVLVDKEPIIRHLYESRVLREFFDFTIKEREILRRRYGIDR